ncbi:MAG: hypothetical protein Q8R76_09960 [Candidatus Omnitrophota bacterium]|nr:hypothetical protein [Candidatus Omnitrophota bacterium]
MILPMLRNEKGIVILTVYMASAFIFAISGASYAKALYEMKQVERQVNRYRSEAAAEAGIQSALAQMSNNAFTGFIDTNAFAEANFSDVFGDNVGAFDVQIDYPDEADWVTVNAAGTVGGELVELEARVFLDSNLSKYLVYASTSNFGSGTNAQYGNPDNSTDKDGNPLYPFGVPANEDDRAGMYFTGRWTASGSNVTLYGDAHAEGDSGTAYGISGSSTTHIYGDAYTSDFAQNESGDVTNDGISGSVSIGDGFEDDSDRNKDGIINGSDYADHHDLTASGSGDAHAKETLVELDFGFYAENNSTPGFAGATAKDRYLQLEVVDGTEQTRVVEYSDSAYAADGVVGEYTLPSRAIVYVKGDIFVKGEISGRVTFVSSDDIKFQDNVTYGGGSYADPYHSTAFLAKDQIFLRGNDIEVSGILYAENAGGASLAFDARYAADGTYDPGSKERLRLYGNRIINGSTNLSYYGDRVYAYDKNLKYYRPPGIPVKPVVRTVREITN